MTAPMYGIAEWYGHPFERMPVAQRQALAKIALGQAEKPPCPFRGSDTQCRKKGGVCTIQPYEIGNGRIGSTVGSPVIVCPHRFAEYDLIPRWLADIAGFDEAYIAREVPFMRSPGTGRPAGRIDLVVASNRHASAWYGLEIQAVYFSGEGMPLDFEELLTDGDEPPPQPTRRRRPDWRSSSAKRLMPQLEVKTPTLRRWGKKLAVAVDLPFFEAVGGKSTNPSDDINDGDIIWLVPEITSDLRLVRHHWEVLSLEASSKKLLAAETIKRDEFEELIRSKLVRLGEDKP